MVYLVYCFYSLCVYWFTGLTGFLIYRFTVLFCITGSMVHWFLWFTGLTGYWQLKDGAKYILKCKTRGNGIKVSVKATVGASAATVSHLGTDAQTDIQT